MFAKETVVQVGIKDNINHNSGYKIYIGARMLPYWEPHTELKSVI